MQEGERTIVLCPGQGAQRVGMGRAWAESSRQANETFREAESLLGYDLGGLCFEGPEERLNRTDVAQPAIFTTSVACWRGLAEKGAAPEIAATAGLSLGELTALHLAGALDFASALRLVQLRGTAMQEAAEATDSAMVALVGVDEPDAQAFCDRVLSRVDAGEILVPANINAPGQVVVSGTRAACDAAIAEAEESGLRANRLAVAGAFHSPVMEPAAERLAEALEEASWAEPSIPVVANVTGTAHDPAPREIKKRLVEQLTHPVRWVDAARWLIHNGPGDASWAELAPGKVLSGLMRRIERKRKIGNHDEPA